MTTIDLPYGKEILPIHLPDSLLGEIVIPNPLPGERSLAPQLQDQLDQPIGSPPLEEIAHFGQKVAVIVDDITRLTPASDILPPVLQRLQRAGIRKEDICIVIALGSHRPMSLHEIEVKVGRQIGTEYEVINTPCDTMEEMLDIGISENGIPAEVNRRVAAADLRIGIGAIVPHMDTGFSGGCKIILPGVCSCDTVNAFHARSADEIGNQLGNMDAPTRRRLESFVEEKVSLHFIVNVVQHPDGTVYRCVAGDAIKAQRTGAKHCQDLFGVAVQKKYPLVIVNSYPFEIDFWQCSKAFWSGERMVSRGGMVLLLSPCPEGLATHPLWAEYLEWDPQDLQQLLKSGNAEDPNACAFAVMFNRLRENVRFAMITPTISHQSVKAMGMTPFDTVAEAIDTTLPNALHESVAVITHGGITVPMI